MTDRRILLNPGPVTLSAAVRAAVPGPDLCHREERFTQLQDGIRRRLSAVHPGQDLSTVLVGGSGTAAVEAMVTSAVPPDGRALVVANGVYGERMAAMLERRGTPCTTLAAPWTEPLDPAAVAEGLDAADVTHVLTVHHETTTGRLNDLAAIGEVCRSAGAELLVDAVSSFGAEQLDLDGWGVAACAATANKCLHGIPGVSFVVGRRDVLDRATHATSLYLDLHRAWTQQEAGTPPFTPPIPAMAALDVALDEHAEAGGWAGRGRAYRERSDLVRGGLVAQGCSLLLDDPAALSSSLTAFRLPRGVDFDRVYRHAESAGFVIYAGQAALMDQIFRVAVMGDLGLTDLERFVDHMGALPR